MHFAPNPDPFWTTASDRDATGAASAAVMFTLEQWLTARGDRVPAQRCGLLLPNFAEVSALAPDLDRLALIVLQFPKWTDGRAYSQARLLRLRHRYGAELRAAGDVRADMLPLLQRTGFSSVQLAEGQSESAARRALRFFSAYYQGDAVEPEPLFQRRAA